MKIQEQFKNSSLISVVNGFIVIKDASGKEHAFNNASVISVNNGTIIIESEWEPKKGELIKMEGNGADCYAVFKKIKDFMLHDYGYKFFNGDQILYNTYEWHIKHVIISPVTQEEQKEFDEFCKSKGIIWNKEKLQWEKYKWKPKPGEMMYFIGGNGKIVHYLYDDTDGILKKYIAINNCFKTEEEAYVKLRKFLEILQK